MTPTAMASARDPLPAERPFPWVRAALVLLAASAACLGVAVLNSLWFGVLNGVLGLQAPVPRALLFSSFLVLLGGVVVIRDPAAWGFRRGAIGSHWRLILATCAGAVVLTWLALRVAGTTPYDDASKVVEIVVVPFTEELVFRAVLLTVLLAVVGRWVGPARAIVPAVVVNAIAFGVGHAANSLSLPVAFVAMQVTFAVVVGLGCAGLMARTRSVYPAMLLHGVVNAVVVFT